MPVSQTSTIRVLPEITFAEFLKRQLKGTLKSIPFFDGPLWRNNWTCKNVWVDGKRICQVHSKDWGDNSIHIEVETDYPESHDMVASLAKQYEQEYLAHKDTFKKDYSNVVGTLAINVNFKSESGSRKGF